MRAITVHLELGHPSLRYESLVEIENDYTGELADHPAVREEMERLVWEYCEVWATEGDRP